MLSRAVTVVAMIGPHSDLAGSASQSSTLQGITVLLLMSVGARSSVIMMQEQGLKTSRADMGRRGCTQVIERVQLGIVSTPIYAIFAFSICISVWENQSEDT